MFDPEKVFGRLYFEYSVMNLYKIPAHLTALSIHFTHNGLEKIIHIE